MKAIVLVMVLSLMSSVAVADYYIGAGAQWSDSSVGSNRCSVDDESTSPLVMQAGAYTPGQVQLGVRLSMAASEVESVASLRVAVNEAWRVYAGVGGGYQTLRFDCGTGRMPTTETNKATVFLAGVERVDSVSGRGLFIELAATRGGHDFISFDTGVPHAPRSESVEARKILLRAGVRLLF